MLQAIEHRKAQYQWPKNGQYDEKERTEGIDAECGSLIDQFQKFAHELLEAMADLKILAVCPEHNVVSDSLHPVFIITIGVFGMGVLIPLTSRTATILANVHLPFGRLFQFRFLMFQQFLNDQITILDHVVSSRNGGLEHPVEHRE
ncbi:hypothetical protein D9M68_770970 [compost metagenome]